MDRNFIERRDFSAARRGYDPDEVDEHLRQVADQVMKVQRSQERSEGLAGTAAEQVRGIIEAAERSAAEIQERADEEATRITRDAEVRAREVREQADSEAAAHVQRVQEATDAMLERASTAESELDQIVASLRQEAGALVDGIRSGAESLRTELDQIRDRLPEFREAGRTPAAPPAGDLGVTEELPAGEAADELAAEGEEPLEPEAEAPAEELEVGEEPLEPEEEAEREQDTEPQRAIAGSEGARLIALNMALNGTPREETARYLEENFSLEDREAVLDDVYSRVGG